MATFRPMWQAETIERGTEMTRDERYYLVFIYGDDSDNTVKVDDLNSAVKEAIVKMKEVMERKGMTKAQAAAEVCILEHHTKSETLQDMFGTFFDD